MFFALLVVCEALAHLSDDKKRERRFDKMGIVFFAIAVLTEIVAYPYGQRNDKLSADIIGSLSDKAGRASAKADAASDKSDATDKKADALQLRLDAASKQLGGIEQKVSAQGPRFMLLADHKAAFVKSLIGFTGQPVTVVDCGPLTSQTEPWILGQFLVNLLRDAKWGKNNSLGYVSWGTCGNVTGVDGVTIVLNSAADEKAKTAANALNDAFAAVPLIARTESGDDKFMDFSGKFFGADSPWAMAAKDHSQLFVLIGPNLGIVPMKKMASATKKTSSKP